MAFFSILVPVYNQKEFLNDCISSIVSQNFEDYELILVDDGSTDGSSEICDAFAKNNNKIVVIHQKNSGLIAARRAALNIAKGKYFLFLDSDDQYRNDALQLLYDTISKTNADMVLYNLSIYPEYYPLMREYPYEDFEVFDISGKDKLYSVLCSSHMLNNLVIKCVRSTLFNDNDYEGYTNRVGYGEDLFQSIPLFDRSELIVFVNEALYFYRQHPQSMTHKYSSKHFESLKIVYSRFIDYSKKWTAEYGTDFYSLLKVQIGRECFNIAKNIISSDDDSKTRISNIKKIKKDPFYIEYADSFVGETRLEKILNKILKKDFLLTFTGFLLKNYRKFK